MNSTIKKVLIATSVAGLVYWAWKRTRKVHEEIENREKENVQALRSQGYSEKQIEKPVETTENQEEEDINLPKEIFEKARFESNVLPTDAVDSDSIFEEGNENIVHLFQTWDKKAKRNFLSFFFRIPEESLPSKGRKSVPDSREILKAIKGTWDMEKQKLVGPCFVDRMKSIIYEGLAKSNIVPSKHKELIPEANVEGYAFIQFKNKIGKTVSVPVLVTRNIYRNNPFNEEHDKVTDFINDLLVEIDDSENGYWETSELAYNYDESGKRVPATVKVFGGVAGVEVKIPVQDNYHLDGINSDMALKIIEEIYNEELLIEGPKGNEMVYDKFLFHSIDSNHCVYTTEPSESGKLRTVIMSTPEFEDWESED